VAAFYDCWTRKEAYIKARGEDLSHPPQDFAVSRVPDERAELLDSKLGREEVSRWSLRELRVGAGRAAALAVGGRGWRLACYEWP
jgi:4'-phosphopantetheinyl transferase